MIVWRWVVSDTIHAIHDRQIAEHGGPAGMRDSSAVESALARPLNLAAYGNPDAVDLAAAYAFGIARNHPFVDGNKRTAWIAARLFLADNGVPITYDPAKTVAVVLALAAGTLSENAFAAWIRERVSP